MKTDDNQINVSTGSDGDAPMRTSSPSASNSSCPALPPVTERQSSAFYVLKGLAIISVICAHFVMGAADGDAAALAEKLRSVCGNLGVPCFFFAAGFFYRRSPRDFAPFWKKKLATVVLPWFIGACVTFALYSFKDRNFADVPQRFCMWFLGLGSWLYFTTALMFCFAWFKVVTGRVNIWLTVALTVASVYMTRLGLIPYCEWFTAYVNPFNWFGFFGLGILARRSESLRLFEKKRPVLFVFGAALAALGVYGRFYFDDFSIELPSGYASAFAIPIEIGAGVVLIGLANLFAKSALLKDLGKKSFAIYLYHMPFVGLIKQLIPQSSVVGIILAPLAVAFALQLGFRILEWLAGRFRCAQILTYLGIR